MAQTRKSGSPQFSFSDYRGWTGDDRWELLGGRAIAMTPSPSRLHQAVVIGLAGQIEPYLRLHRCEAYAAPFDVRLPEAAEADEAIDTVVQPDLSVICDPKKLDDLGCRGAPDWVIEVLSPPTAARDRVQKRDLYERHGVREYWLVDPTERSLTVYLRSAEVFAAPDVGPAAGRTPCHVVSGLSIDWDLIFR